MAVAFDASSESHTGTTGATADFNWQHTPTGTPRAVVVFVFNREGGTSGDLSSVTVTYGGVAMTPVAQARDSTAGTEGGYCRAYILGRAVPTGQQTVAVAEQSSGFVDAYAACITFTAGADCWYAGVLTEQDNQTLTEENISDGSIGINSVRVAGVLSGASTPPPAGTNSTLTQSIDYSVYSNSVVYETTPGQGSRPVGCSYGTSDDVAAVYFAVREITSLGPSGIASGEAFGKPLHYWVVDAFGKPQVVMGALPPGVRPGGIASGETFGTSRQQRYLRNAGAMASAEVFGTGKPVLLLRNAGAIAGAEALGFPLSGRILRGAGAMATGEGFGQGSLGAWRISTAGGIASLEATGLPRLPRILRGAGAIPSLETLGNPTLPAGALFMRVVGGIASAETFGNPLLYFVVDAFGKPQLILGGFTPSVRPEGIVSAEVLGTPTAQRWLRNAGAIASAEVWGNALLPFGAMFVSSVGGITSAEVFGIARALRTLRYSGAIASGEAWGTPTRGYRTISSLGAITSAETFGKPLLYFIVDAFGKPQLILGGKVLRSAGAISSGEAFGTTRLIVPRSIFLFSINPPSLAMAGGPFLWQGEDVMGTPGLGFVGGAIRIGAIASAEAFGTQGVRGILRLLGLTTGETFGAARANRILRAAGISSAEAFGLMRSLTLLRTIGMTSAEAFGMASPIAVLRLAGISSAEGVGQPLLPFGGRFLTLVGGISSAEGFGVLQERSVLRALGITPAEVFGQGTLTTGRLLTLLGGISSLEAIGQHEVERYIRGLGAIAGAEAVGKPLLPFGARFLTGAGAITSAEVFGQAYLRRLLRTTGIASAEALSSPWVISARLLRPTGVLSAEALGLDAIRFVLRSESIGSSEGLGTPGTSRRLRTVGLPGAEALGQPRLGWLIDPLGIAGAEAVGIPRMTRVVQVIGITSGVSFGMAMLGDETILIKPSVPGEILLSDSATWELALSDGEMFLIGVDDLPTFDLPLDDMPGG